MWTPQLSPHSICSGHPRRWLCTILILLHRFVVIIDSAEYPKLSRLVTFGGFLEPFTSESKLDALSALSSISILSNDLSLFDTLVFFAISVLVCTILQYLDSLTLRSIITVDGASLVSTELMFEDASTICCEFKSEGAVLGDSSWAIGPLESILESVSSPLWRSRISPAGILLITRISDWRRLICSSIFLIAIIRLECDSWFDLSGSILVSFTSASRTLHHRQILFSNDQILVSDRRTDAINILWAFLDKN